MSKARAHWWSWVRAILYNFRDMTLTNKTMGNTAEQAKLLDDAMSKAAANSTFGMSDAATASLNFARAGLNAEQAAAALAPAMNLAAGEGGNLDKVSAGLVGTINGFGDSFDKTTHYADVFAAACNNSALDVDSLSDSMGTAAPVFSAAGYSVSDAALYMGVMVNNGIGASEAANSLKTGLARLVSPAKDGQTALDKLNWSILDENGCMKVRKSILGCCVQETVGLLLLFCRGRACSARGTWLNRAEQARTLQQIEKESQDLCVLGQKLIFLA